MISDRARDRDRLWTVITGDWQDHVDLLRGADLLIADPPYSEHTHAKSRAGKRAVPLRDGNGRMSRCARVREVDFGFPPISHAEREQLADLASTIRRWSLVFSDVESSHLWADAFVRAGLDYCRTGAWIKIGCTPQFTGDRPGVGFEAITICHRKGRKHWNGGGKAGIWEHLTCIERGGKSTANDTREHPTQKPVPLMVALGRDFGAPGELVIDPYCGSGTTLVACIRLGIRCIGVERNPEWAEIARQRCEAEEASSDSRSVAAGQLSLLGGQP